MSTKVSQFMGGLGVDARDKLTLQSNATVTFGDGTSTSGNILVGRNIAIANSNPVGTDFLVVGGNVRLASGSLIFPDGTTQTTAGDVVDVPTGDYGLLDSANTATDAFGKKISGLDTYDMLTTPIGDLTIEDLGALS